MKLSHGLVALLALAAMSAFTPRAAQAGSTFAVNCGTGGSTDPLQAQIDLLGVTRGNIINVTGTCVGAVDTSGADILIISGLSLTGTLSMSGGTSQRFNNLTLNGSITVANARNLTFTNTKIHGDITVMRGSQAVFNTLTSNTWSDTSGTHDPAFNCVGQSECTLNAATLTGGGATATSIAVLAASGARLNVQSGTITGFGIGVQAWNNATAFVTTVCDPLSIRGNLVSGVNVSDGGMVKIAGTAAADALSFGCPTATAVTVDLGSNGKYGVLADGGGNAYLQMVRISGHTLDGVRVQHGSVVRVRNSTIDAATSSGRSARVKAQAHLYFDEQEAGPTARSTLAGPVCITGSSTVDTDNSSTSVTVRTNCSGP